MEEINIAWLSGLFEGEGCIGLSRQGFPTLQIGMTDEDVVQKAFSIAGVGTIRTRKKPTNGGKFMTVWSVGKCDEAAHLIEIMLPFFGQRRYARALEVLAAYNNAAPPKRLRTHCKRGHSFAGDNLVIDISTGKPRRGCRKCCVVRQQDYRNRHPERSRESNRKSKLKRKLILKNAS